MRHKTQIKLSQAVCGGGVFETGLKKHAAVVATFRLQPFYAGDEVNQKPPPSN
jgi:hypothetical protein